METIEIDPALLSDGRLNVSLKSNIILDWAVLHAQVTPLPVNTQAVVATADTYVRGGSHKEESFGLETQMWVKNEDDGDNSRRAYLIWNLQSVTRPVVGATVRLFCNASAQEGNVYYAAVAVHDDWGEQFLTWNNQPSAHKPVAYFVPRPGEFVEFSLLPQVVDALSNIRSLPIQIWAIDQFRSRSRALDGRGCIGESKQASHETRGSMFQEIEASHMRAHAPRLHTRC